MQNAKVSSAYLGLQAVAVAAFFIISLISPISPLVIFLPKFHCELNFIEQCWGFAKRIYRLNPESSREDHLEKNALDALEAVPLTSMHKFTTRSH